MRSFAVGIRVVYVVRSEWRCASKRVSGGGGADAIVVLYGIGKFEDAWVGGWVLWLLMICIEDNKR